MRHDRDMPAEVRAAQRAIGLSAVDPQHPGTAAIAAGAPITGDIDGILNEILEAEQVDIIGILPWRCAERLIEMKRSRILAGQPVIRPREVRYYTPSTARVASYRQGPVLGSIVQRWEAGIDGIRNWLRSEPDEPDDANISQIYELDEVYLDCLISTLQKGRRRVTLLSELPGPRVAGQDEGLLMIITHMADEQIPQFLKYMTRVRADADPMAPRHILCEPGKSAIQPSAPGNEFRPVVLRLHQKYTASPPESASAIAIAVVCASTARGPAVLLKQRTPRTSVDDLGKLSLTSRRVLVEDLSDSAMAPLDGDNERALEQLWIRAGKPDSFEIPERSFRRAAQRELFVACGLDIPDERLKLRGTCLIEREGEHKFLGMYVYRVDLMRSAELDELTYALTWNRDLHVVLLEDLYKPEIRQSLNRLLRQRESWLREAVFFSAPEGDTIT